MQVIDPEAPEKSSYEAFIKLILLLQDLASDQAEFAELSFDDSLPNNHSHFDNFRQFAETAIQQKLPSHPQYSAIRANLAKYGLKPTRNDEYKVQYQAWSAVQRDLLLYPDLLAQIFGAQNLLTAKQQQELLLVNLNMLEPLNHKLTTEQRDNIHASLRLIPAALLLDSLEKLAADDTSFPLELDFVYKIAPDVIDTLLLANKHNIAQYSHIFAYAAAQEDIQHKKEIFPYECSIKAAIIGFGGFLMGYYGSFLLMGVAPPDISLHIAMIVTGCAMMLIAILGGNLINNALESTILPKSEIITTYDEWQKRESITEGIEDNTTSRQYR